MPSSDEASADYILDLTHCQLDDMSSLSSLAPTIATLILRRNRLEQVTSNVYDNEHLVHLDLYDNGLETLERLPPKLAYLDASFNRIRRVSLGGLAGSLKELYLASNQICELDSVIGLAELKQLRILELGANRIEAVEDKALPASLEELYLGRNALRTIGSSFSRLANLRILSLQSNVLTHLDGLEQLKQLEELYLSDNQLTDADFSRLQSNSRLRILDIADNRISEIRMSHGSLQELWANGNRLAEWDGLQLDLPLLSTIYLHSNRISKDADYKDRIRAILPSLRQIDAE